MASRLSEESLKAVYDAGHMALPVASDVTNDVLIAPALDLDALLETKVPAKAVQAVPAQTIFRAIMTRGPEDCLEVLRLLSKDQALRIMDYDAWVDDRLVPERLFRWLNLYKEMGNPELYKRFSELDEEYQLAVFGPFVELVDEESFEKLPGHLQDEFIALPCNTLFYRITTEDKAVREGIQDVVAAALSENLAYAYSLLAHAAYVPPAEQEAQVAQFRRARLEEDGFVSYEESLACFRRLDVSELRATWQEKVGNDKSALPVLTKETPDNFFAQVMGRAVQIWTPDQYEQVTASFAFVGNSLASVCRVEAGDDEGLKVVTSRMQALVGLGLEYLSSGSVETAVRVLSAEHPLKLFRAGLSLTYDMQEVLLSCLEDVGYSQISKLRKTWAEDRRGELLRLLDLSAQDELGHLRAETLKGVFNRFPLRPKIVGHDVDARVVFVPIASIEDLKDTAQQLDKLVSMLKVASYLESNDEDLVSADIDTLLMTGIAHTLLGNSFARRPLKESELSQLASLDQSAVNDTLTSLLAEIEKRLTNDLNGTSWSVSKSMAFGGTPVSTAVAELSDLIMRFSAALARDRKDGLQTIYSLVLKELP